MQFYIYILQTNLNAYIYGKYAKESVITFCISSFRQLYQQVHLQMYGHSNMCDFNKATCGLA